VIAHVKKALWLFLLMSNLCLGLVIVAALWRWSQPQPEPSGITAILRTFSPPLPAPSALDYKDLIAILLTALGVMIAVGALFFAFVAVIGYHEGVALIERLVNKRLDDVLQPKAARALLDASATVVPAVDANEIAASVDDDNAKRS
jgi:hypothetical protein